MIKSEEIKEWHSNWKGGAKGSFDYLAKSGTTSILDPITIKTLKEPLFAKSKGKWNQSGSRYLFDRKGKIYGAVLSSNSEGDIHNILTHQVWQHGTRLTSLTAGMPIFVVPDEDLIKKNPNATGVRFILEV